MPKEITVDGVTYVPKESGSNPELAEIAIVLDRSGSMESIRADMEGGFKTFMDEQRNQPGECVVSLYQFDDRYEVVYEAKPIAEVSALGLKPRGSTALLDAVGRSLTAIGERHANLPENQRPGAVVVLIITDGAENASREWDLERVKSAIADAENTRKWKLVFMAADASAFAQAGQYGFNTARMGLVGKNSAGVGAMYAATSASVGSYRSAVMSGDVNADMSVDQDALETDS